MDKYIPLNQGKFSLVSSADFDSLSEFKWSALSTTNGFHYAVRHTRVSEGVPGRTVYMHRQVLGVEKGTEVDHINGDRLDNRRENLRVCTREQNCSNVAISKTNTSGFKGVTWHKSKKRWLAMIRFGGRKITLGAFKDRLEASECYNEACRSLHGEFARY